MSKVLAIGADGKVQETEAVTLVPVAGTSIPMYFSTAGEYFFVQNNMAQHTVQILSASHSANVALVTMGMVANQTVVGTGSGYTINNTNEWTQLPKVRYLNPAYINSLAGVYRTSTSHFISQNPALQFSTIVSFFFGIGETPLFAAARMFVGDTNSVAAPTDIDPRTMTNCIGLIESNTAPNPDNLYFMINGTSATPHLIDTGMPVALDVGYKFTIFYGRNTRVIGLRVSNINTDAAFETTVDLSTLPATNQPATGAYASRIWRGNGGTVIVSNVGILFSRIYWEFKN